MHGQRLDCGKGHLDTRGHIDPQGGVGGFVHLALLEASCGSNLKGSSLSLSPETVGASVGSFVEDGRLIN